MACRLLGGICHRGMYCCKTRKRDWDNTKDSVKGPSSNKQVPHNRGSVSKGALVQLVALKKVIMGFKSS